jgi:hypothetical protein
MDKLIAQDFDGCLAILEEQKKINGEPADVSKRRPEHHQGDATNDPQYLCDDLNVYVPSGVHPIPPGAWPGEGGDTAAAFLRAKARHCKENPPGPDFAGVTPKFGN